jgi:hypothetical protein
MTSVSEAAQAATSVSWPEMISALGVWAGLLGGAFAWAYRGRAATLAAIKKQITDLDEKSTEEHTAHEAGLSALSAQMSGMALDISKNYVRKADFDQGIAGIHGVIAEGRREIGAVHNRVDKLFENVQFRRGHADG